MDPPFRVSATPGTPLFPISPERANKQLPNHAMTNTPPAPTLSFHGHSRTNLDVQGKVEKFNSLTKEASERRRAHEAALKRAIVGREEAENEARRTKDELRKLKAELSEGKDRERKVGERVENLMVGLIFRYWMLHSSHDSLLAGRVTTCKGNTQAQHNTL
jgi:hypothetical protein